jgi:hypothetical protein
MRNRIRTSLAAVFAGVFASTLFGWVRNEAPLWTDGQVAIHLQLGATPTYSDGSTPNTTALEALRAWNIAISRVQLVGVTNSNAAIGSRNGVSNVFFSPNIYGQAFDSGVLAVTLTHTSGGNTVETDVVVNQSQTWDSYRGTRSLPDLRRVLGHEFGHVLGLGHPDQNGESTTALMNSRIGTIESPSTDDLDGAAALYGVGIGLPGTVPPTVQIAGQNGIEEGDPAVLTAFVTGQSPVIFQWFRNGTLIPGANRRVLRIERTAASDSGAYTVVVTNSAGSATSNTMSLLVNPSTAPVISSFDRRNQIVSVGTPVSFSANLRGRGPFTFTWRRDGVIILEYTSPSSSSAAFSLEKTTLADSGNYTVTVTGPIGSATSEVCTLTVQPPENGAPVILRQMASAMVDLETRAILSPVVSDVYSLTFEWRKDGVLIPNQRSSSLIIESVKGTDYGVYTFKATNAYGSVEGAPARLQPTPPRRLRITSPPAGRRLLAPDLLSMSVNAVGTPPLQYQWFKDGSALPGQTMRSLGGLAQVPSDLGTFTVVVSNATERVTSEPALWSFDAAARLLPVFSQPPAPLTVGINQPAELSAVVSFLPTPQNLQWRKDGIALPGQTDAVLRFTSARLSDTGDYSIAVTNAAGTTISKTVRLTVSDTLTPIIRRNPSDQEVDQGEPAYFRIELVPNSWQSIRWQRNGVFLPGSETDTTFGVRPFTAAEEGSYRAVITTPSGGVIFSEPASLKVNPKRLPFISSRLPNFTVSLGEGVSFYARVDTLSLDEYTDTTYQWRRNGVPLSGRTTPRLEFPSIREEDFGRYTLTVTNYLGSVTSNESIISKVPAEPPIILQQPMSAIAAAGTGAGFEVEGAPLHGLRYQWRLDGVPLPGYTDSRLSVMASASALGRYSVALTNAGGTVISDDAILTLKSGTAAPLFQLQPQSQRASVGSDVAFSAFAAGLAPIAYQWFKDGRELAGATSSTLGLSVLDASIAGMYTVVASNSLGRASSEPATLSVDAAGRLLNLSARAFSRGGNDRLIVGFVVQGVSPKRLLLRGIGPALTALGVAGALTDPMLILYDASGRARQSLDNWGDYVSGTSLDLVTKRVGAFTLPPGSKDSAFITTLEPGTYTVHLTNPELAGPRVGLVEIYDAESGTPRLINLSTRARVESGEGALIAGFVVDAGEPKRVLIRAIGPALAAFGVGDSLADPKLEIFRASEQRGVTQNDNWSDADADELTAAFARVGAFPLVRGSKDAALIATLPPGAYTTKVTGVNDTTGAALIEVYELSH